MKGQLEFMSLRKQKMRYKNCQRKEAISRYQHCHVWLGQLQHRNHKKVPTGN